MNHIYRLVWNSSQQAYVAVTETAKSRGKSSTKVGGAVAALILALSSTAATLPTGGQVTAGAASISSTTNTLTVNQSSQRAAINWQSFSVGRDGSVNFVQPNASSVVLNRVVGSEQSVIAGAMNANGQVFLLNANGVLFTGSASVNTGGLVASTMNLSDADFMAGKSTFTCSGASGSVINLGSITVADGGYVALLGNQVKNEGVINARLGSAILTAGDKISLNFNGDSIVGVVIDKGTLNALVENKQAIYADGGQVILTAKAVDKLLANMVNNTGEIRARTIAEKNGKIYLLGEGGIVNVDGTLDASAPNGGNGGFVETSGPRVKIADNVKINTKASNGQNGKWLIDPLDFTIAASGGDITGIALGTLLNSNSITIETATSPTGTSTNLVGSTGTNGDIIVNDPVNWSANNTLTLNAYRNININADITASGATGKLSLLYGQGAVATGNTADYNIAPNIKISLHDGQNFTTKLGSDGTPVNYTVVHTASDLQNMDLTGNTALGADVDLASTGNWQPIGNETSMYLGKFEGLGHSVANLTIDGDASGRNYLGLFGYAAQGLLRDLSLVNPQIVNSTGVYFGSLAGVTAYGEVINNVHVIGGHFANLTGYGMVDTTVGGLVGDSDWTTIIGSSAGVSISITKGVAGGLIGLGTNVLDMGMTATQISNSYSYGEIALTTGSASSYAGGLIGYLSGTGTTLTNSYSLATASSTAGYVGGLIGGIQAPASVTNAYATGVVSTDAGNGSNAGGLFGQVVGSPTLTSAFWDTNTTGQTYAAGGGSSTSGAMANAGAYTQSNYTGFDFTSSGAWFSVDGYTRPFLRMEWTPVISNAHQLQLMLLNVNGRYTLANNINLAPSLNNKNEMWRDNSASIDYANFKGSFLPVSTFAGSFDGTGHIIDALRIDKAQANVGFFGQVGSGARIKDVGLTNIDIHGGSRTGGLVGYLYGSNVNIDRVFTTGNISSSQAGNAYGGLVGYLFIGSGSTPTTISDCYSSVNLFRDSRGFNISNVGGLVGTLGGNTAAAIVSNSYATGSLTQITGGAGGLIGSRSYSNNQVINSFWDVQTSGTGTAGSTAGSAGGTGLATADMKLFATFGGTTPAWDIVTDPSLTSVYPQLRWATSGLGAGTSVWVIGPTSLNYTLSSLGSIGSYNGSAYTLSGLWSDPATIFGSSSYSAWVPGTDYTFQYGGNTVTGFTNAGSYSNISVSILHSGYSVAGSGNTAGSLTIDPKVLTISGTTATGKTYDGSSTASIIAGTLNGLVGSETLNISPTGTFDSANAGARTATAHYTLSDGSNGGLAGNYSLADTTHLATIDPKVLTVTGTTATDRSYDGSRNASFSVGTLSGFVGSETVTATATGLFDAKDAGSRTATAHYALADGTNGGLAGNYRVDDTTGLAANITPRLLNVSLNGGSGIKTYDGTSNASPSMFVLTNVVQGETVSLGGNATISGKDVGMRFVSAMGDLASLDPNYTLLPALPAGPVWVMPKPITVTGTTVAGKTYDGSTTANLSGGTLVGVISGDTVNLTQTGSFADKSAANGKTVTVADSISGTDSGNYTLTQPTGLVGDISAKTLTVTGTTVAGKTYDGSTTANLSGGTLVGVISGDTVNLTQTGSFADKSAANGKTVTAADSLSGTDSGNYTLTQPTGLSADISAKALTVTGTSASGKTYDGSTTANLSGGTLVGVISGDTVNLTQAGNYADKNVGTGKTITVADSLSGTDSGNYTLTQPTSLSSDIAPRPVSVATASGATRVFDGSTSVSPSLLSITNLIPGDTVALSGKGTLASSAVGSEPLSSLGGLTLDNPNYTLTDGTPSGSVMITAAFDQSIVVSSSPPSQPQPQAADNLNAPAHVLGSTPMPPGQPTGFANVVTPLPQISAAFGNGTPLAIVSAPLGSEPTQVVTISQARSMLPGGGQAGNVFADVRVPVSRNSLEDIVNGGVRLPDGLEQELFVVEAN